MINETEHCRKQSRKDTQEKLDGDACQLQYVNDASVDLNEVCLRTTYFFLKEPVFVSDVFLLALLSHENLHSLSEVVSRVFSPESTPLAYSSLPYSANLIIFYLFIYFILISNIFFSNRSLGTFFHGFCIPFPLPDSRFHALVLPPKITFAMQNHKL